MIAQDPTSAHHLFDVATSGGLFDPEYYCDESSLGAMAPIDAFADYLWRGRFTDIDPSPSFSSVDYLNENRSALRAAANPLIHYLESDQEIPPPASRSTRRWRPYRRLLNDNEVGDTGQTVGLHLHAHYLDVIEPVIEAVCRLRPSIELLITVTSSDAERYANSLTTRNQIEHRSTVLRVPNRGRNIGPLLIDAAPWLHQFDVVGHLHSKKSLAAGRENLAWALYLHNYLLYDTELVERTLRVFNQFENVGIVYPTTFHQLGARANSWGANGAWSESLSHRLGIGLRQATYFSYPVGCMFWARPAALEPLFRANFVRNEFPEEPNVEDGSLLHGIERIVGDVVESTGHRQVYIDPSTRCHTEDSTFVYRNFVTTWASVEILAQRMQAISYVLDPHVGAPSFAPGESPHLSCFDEPAAVLNRLVQSGKTVQVMGPADLPEPQARLAMARAGLDSRVIWKEVPAVADSRDAQYWKRALDDLAIAPNTLLHLGTDPYYDEAVPHSLGIRTRLFLSCSARADALAERLPHAEGGGISNYRPWLPPRFNEWQSER